MTTTALWSDDGPVKVADRIHRIPLPLPQDALRAVNVYAIEDGNGLVLIDSGWAMIESRQALQRALGTLGYELGDVTRFLVTHVHRDHYTLGVTLRREFGSRLALGLGEQPALELMLDPGREPFEARIALLQRCGADELLEQLRQNLSADLDIGQWGLPDEWLRDRQTIELADRRLEVIATPGHTQGHVVFVDRAHQLMFSGDHVLPHITPSIGLEPTQGANKPLADYLESLALVADLPDLRMLPAHGDVKDSVHARVGELQEHHRRRLDQSEAALRAGAHTAYETAEQLKWTRREHDFASLDLFNAMMAVTETHAHLEVLVLQGRATVAEVDGAQHYQATSAPTR